MANKRAALQDAIGGRALLAAILIGPVLRPGHCDGQCGGACKRSRERANPEQHRQSGKKGEKGRTQAGHSGHNTLLDIDCQSQPKTVLPSLGSGPGGHV